MKKPAPAASLPTVALLLVTVANCKPAAGAINPDSGQISEISCLADSDCAAALGAGNCVGASSGAGICQLCRLAADCAPIGPDLICDSSGTCQAAADGGPGVGHCAASCDCGKTEACVQTVCAAPPPRCMADADCVCGALCESHNCLLRCEPDAGNADCRNPTPKCYGGNADRCGFCAANGDCPSGESCLPNGSCGTMMASSATSAGTAAGGATTSGNGGAGTAASGSGGAGTGSGTNGGSSGLIGGGNGGQIGGIIGGIIGSGAGTGGLIGGGTGGLLGGGTGGLLGGGTGGLNFTCDGSTCAGCAAGQTCQCADISLSFSACTPGTGCSFGLPGICM